MINKVAWEDYDEKEFEKLNSLNNDYIDFLSDCKTERECVKRAVQMAKEKGYKDLNEIIKNKESINIGDKVYYTYMDKSIVMFNIGDKPLEEGLNILGAHIDSPRLDVKQNPMYEDSGLCYLDTHYYGGIKKYQWVTIPLAIHGVVVKPDGKKIDIVIGEDKDDNVLFISDILIHLAQNQMEKKGNKVVEGEALDILIGNMPLKGEKKEGVKKNILKLLKEKYDIEEKDFISAELEIVPAGRARSAGLDGSMVLSYGHDDRVCAYTSLVAMLNKEKVEKTSCLLLVDKEEIGSVGATGMKSKFFENALAELLDRMGVYSELTLRRVLANSKMLSSDVNAAYDPLYADAFEKKNASFFGKGLVINKFTGSRGKSGSNDANAEYLGYLRNVFEKGNVAFQTAELGKVDQGGGGTIAYIMALYGMDVVDSGVAVLNMHAPHEAVSKADVYEAMKGYTAFISE
ncbi:Aspartyl aminopeptidase [Lachnospiraceae bacterium RM5]|nr:Aspartyl aminopeptidase [Lachnospiraceae bacterium RM5]